MTFPKGEELKEKLCIVCKGTGKYDGEVCFHCNGNKITYWPERCGGDCSKCNLPPVNPKFKVGDMIAYGVTGKAVITNIYYRPCSGNMYEYKGGGIPEDAITKIASHPTLNSFFKNEGGNKNEDK